MKNLYKLFFLAAIILNSCAASRISFDVLAPAPLYIPNSLQSIAIVDRSLPENSELNKLEGILTGEGKEQDRLATQFVIDGLNRSLSTAERYNVLRTDELLVGSGSGFLFPDPMTWDQINELCEKHNVDAIVSLETYDSDFVVTSGTKTGKSILEFNTQGIVTVKCGFRMYYPLESLVVDEFHFSHKVNWDGGRTLIGAAGALLNKKKVIADAGFEAGTVYGRRITPSWYLASRDYFKKSKSNPDLDEGARMMQLNDWDKAIAALERTLDNGGRKDQGRAAHNLAVVYEILSDLDLAKEYTSLAWGKYKEKKSRDYGYILTRRINDRRTLDNQLNKN